MGVQYLLLGFLGGVFFCWLYLKFQMKNIPYGDKSLANLKKKNEEQRKYILKRIDILKKEQKEILVEYDDPNKSWH